MTRETLREQLIASGRIRPAGHGNTGPTKSVLRIDDATIIAASSEILRGEGLAVAAGVVENPSADARVRAHLARRIQRMAVAA
jgi:hypothetical protein